MITNLLDKDVVFQDKNYKICSIYQYEEKFVQFGLVDAEGNMIFGVSPSETRVNEFRIYSVIMFHSNDRKIHAIKVVREITGIGLKDAKDLVEANPAGVKLIDKLKYSEAEDKLKIVVANGLEGQILKIGE